MKPRTHSRHVPPIRLAIASAVSLFVHALVLWLLLPILLQEDEFEPVEAAEPEFEVSVVTEEDLQKEVAATIPPPVPPPDEIEPVKAPEPQPKVEKPPEPTKVDRKVVNQVTNEERPEEAKFLSERDNRTSQETRARDTTLENVIPSKTERDKEAAKIAKASVPEPKPRPRPTRKRRPLADPSELVKKPTEVTEQNETGGVRPVERRRKLFEVSEDDYLEVVGHDHDEAAHREMQDKRLLAGWEDDERIMRGALENFITEVQPGNHTSVNAYGRAWADYLGRIHRKIHARWAADYLATLDIREPAGSPLNDPTLNTKLEFVIRASDGEIQRINIVKGSGELRFDAEAISISTSAGPHPHAPNELVSPDGNVYVHWNFWRNQRQCGVFGASVFLVEKDELTSD